LLPAPHADGLAERSSVWVKTGENCSVTMTNAAIGAGIADNCDTRVAGSSAQLVTYLWPRPAAGLPAVHARRRQRPQEIYPGQTGEGGLVFQCRSTGASTGLVGALMGKNVGRETAAEVSRHARARRGRAEAARSR